MAAHENLGKQFRQRLRNKGALSILDAHPSTEGCDWGEGGCRIAATALHRNLPGSSVHAVWDASGKEPEHFVVHHEGVYYDHRGAQSPGSLIKNWTDPHRIMGVPNPVVRPTTEAEMERSSALDPTHESGERSSDMLARYLAKRMNP